MVVVLVSTIDLPLVAYIINIHRQIFILDGKDYPIITLYDVFMNKMLSGKTEILSKLRQLAEWET
jgi:hypothetical protein